MARRRSFYREFGPGFAGLAACGAFFWFPKHSMALVMLYGMHKIAPFMHVLQQLLHHP